MERFFFSELKVLEDELSSIYGIQERFRAFCIKISGIFSKKYDAKAQIIPDGSVLSENGKQHKPAIAIPFFFDNFKYTFELYLKLKKNEQHFENDEVLKNLVRIIDRYLGDVDKNFLKSEKYCLYEKSWQFYVEQDNEDFSGGEEEPQEKAKNVISNFYERDVLFELMPFKVKEILMIASLYDAFTIENEGNFTQKILGEFSKLNLTSFPRVTAVSYYDEAYAKMCEKHYDLVIVMVGNDKKNSSEVVERLYVDFPEIPVFLLLNNNADVSEFIHFKFSNKVDNLFIWNGDSRIFFSMIKLLEDKVNLKNDARYGLSRIILIVEDTPRFYSRYLPEIYNIIFRQTRDVMESVNESDELYKVLRLRVRPRILLVSTYEDAKKIFDEHKDNFLSLITDVEFYRNGEKDKDAGIELAKYVKKKMPDIDIPIVIQSSDINNKAKADEIGCSFIYKKSNTLAHDIRKVVKYNMGFGDFIYRDENGKELGYRAKNLKDFEYYLGKIPDGSLLYHALRNHFSLWLLARGETNFAMLLARLRSEDFEGPEHIRKFLINNIKRLRYERTKGKIVEFDENDLPNESTVVTLSSGALGGKGRGLVFINKLVYGLGLADKIDYINIKTPSTFIIGTDTYDEFIETNNLRDIIFDKEIDYQRVRKIFLNAWLSEEVVQKLRKLVASCRKPLAVRSSGLFEDSLMQPFAGVFETYIIPNNHPDFEHRLKQLIAAVKLVYASVFSPVSRGYIEAVDYKIEEEKMAVVIQTVVGNEFDGYYYPHISGTAQSLNYYPFSYIKPEDGLATLALGLGVYVVGGDRAFHFTPKYPKLLNYSLKELVNNSQVHFYAVDLKKTDLNLLEGENAGLKKLDLWDAEKHGTLKHLASVYDPNNNLLTPGLDKQGPRVLDFANILKYNYIPLAKTIDEILHVVKEAMGSPVEIEFAVDLNKDENGRASFYLLQIKPLLGNSQDYEINVDELNFNKLLFFTTNAMGNGIIEKITDVVYVVPERFNKSYTEQMAAEFEHINKKMKEEGRKYVLVSPGRLGTRDKWIGVPVAWSQISQAKVIIETSLPNFPLDASAGSHFFHNVVSMNVGYFSIQHNNPDHFLRWEILEKQHVVDDLTYVRRVRFSEPLVIKMDGKKRIAVIEVKE